MKKRYFRYIIYSLSVLFIIITGLLVYWYYNPSVDNRDFDLEFRVSNENKNFHKERNKKIDPKNFTYNNEKYINDVDKYELTIHSLDIINGNERIIIVMDSLDKKHDFKVANITYKDKNGKNSSPIIEHRNDSVFIFQNILNETNLLFKGKKN